MNFITCIVANSKGKITILARIPPNAMPMATKNRFNATSFGIGRLPVRKLGMTEEAAWMPCIKI